MEGNDGSGGGSDSNLMRLFSRGVKKVFETELSHLSTTTTTATTTTTTATTALFTAVGSSLDNYMPISWELLVMFISSYLVLFKLAQKFLAQFHGRSEKKTGLIVQVVL